MQHTGNITFIMISTILFSLAGFRPFAQTAFKQSVKGYVTDAASGKALPGVTVMFQPSGLSAISDSSGYYVIRNLPLGRYSIEYSTIGYESRTLSDILVTSGKENEQNISLTEKFKNLDNITVSSSRNRLKPINEFATVSARSFSIEDTKRYPAAFSDPARMVMNFPGVAASNDGDNSIVVRGNSPSGVLWKLEGIEIPTPNHFSNLGATGGPISMLSSNVIGRSDFYVGAFPAEIGNATSAAFDLHFRNGNKEKAEHSVMLGTLGAELSTEGPLGKSKNASYLINYRYSTLALLKSFINLDGEVPDYQDISFKLNWKTARAGEFGLFGLGGYNRYSRESLQDSTKWDSDEPNISYKGSSKLGVVGLTHQVFLGSNAYLKTVISASYTQSGNDADTLNPAAAYIAIPASKEAFTNKALRFSTYYNVKLNARNTMRTGFILQQWYHNLGSYYYDDKLYEWKQVLEGAGNTQFYQAFVQWKYRFTDRLSLNSGLHGSYLALNRKSSLEPRAALSYAVRSNTLSLGAGFHSRPEHISTYLFEEKTQNTESFYPNKNLDLSRALHIVFGFEHFFNQLNLRAKSEIYFQHLYKIPVEAQTPSGFSTINMEDVYDLLNTGPLVSKGTGKNYGIDLSLEKPFSNNYYFMSTLSLFRSTYRNYAGEEYNTRYARRFTYNFTGGKEWQGSRNPNRILGVSAKLLGAGGLRNSEIDIPASRASGNEELVAGRYFTGRNPAYLRFDVSAYIKKDRKRATHIISLEIQNLTNRENIYNNYFDERSGTVKTSKQLGILPNLSYKIQFH